MPDKYIGAEGLAAIKTWTLSLLGSNSPTGFKSTIGDGSALEYTITHNLGTQDVIIQANKLKSLEPPLEPEREITRDKVMIQISDKTK